MKFVNPKASVGLLSKEELVRIKEVQKKNADLLRIPRRPVWKDSNLDGKELQAKEREAFLEWRRDLSRFIGVFIKASANIDFAIIIFLFRAQENEALKMTPFEKNLEFWRQLWRVIERSDVVVQIVDARNPLLFYCQDVEKYVKEIDSNKVHLILINKSDFLTVRQRLEWLRYFEKHSVRVAFWSAVISHQLNDLANLAEEPDENNDDGDEDDDEKSQSVEQDEYSENNDEEESSTDGLDAEMNKFDLLDDEKCEPSEEIDKTGPENAENTEQVDSKSDDEEATESENSEQEASEYKAENKPALPGKLQSEEHLKEVCYTFYL